MDSLDVKLDLFWIALWKHVLLVEIIRHRYKVNSDEAKQRFLTALKEKIKRDPSKIAALDYLNEFEGRFWCEADERVREITEKFTERISSEARGQLGYSGAGVSGALASGIEDSSEVRTELADRFQHVVNETQLGKLNKMLAVLNDEILDDAHHMYVVIDDLDRDWVDERLSNDLIRCLFRTVLDMQRVRNLKVLVALRTNIFQELDFGDRSGGQEEKFRALVLRVQWDRATLEELLDERVRVAGLRAELEASTIGELLPHTNRTRGNPLTYMFDRTLLRPRDAIAFVNECLARGAGKTRLSWEDIQVAEREYSAKRLLALRDEWKPTYPGVDRLFEKFRGASARMDRKEFQSRLEECMLLLSDPGFSGVRWLTQLSDRMWVPSTSDPSWYELYQPLAAMLYRLGAIGCAPRGNGAPVFFSDVPLLMDSESSVERIEYFHVHRMLHKALDVRIAREV